MNKDEEVAIDLIKEFLKVYSLNGTLECLEKESKLLEINQKNTKKNKDDSKVNKSMFNLGRKTIFACQINSE